MTQGCCALRTLMFGLLMLGLASWGPVLRADEAEDDPAMAALQEVQEIVGDWDGLGAKSDKSAAWNEAAQVAWKFGKNSKVSLYFTFKAGKEDKAEGAKGSRYFDEAAISFDKDKKTYRLKAYLAGGGEDQAPLEFDGKRTKTGLVFDRVNKGKAKDDLDRLEFKILNDGDRVAYTVSRKLGKTHRAVAQVGLTRQGTAIAAKEGGNGPKCIVTGGAGTMAISYEGQTYFVCCTGCREAFLANPQKYIAKAKKG